jgi:membrane protease YdiL (CAAX protease family)
MVASHALLAAALLLALAVPARAQAPSSVAPPDSFPFSPAVRSDLLLPLVSILLPGYGQYRQGQVVPGLAYSAVAAGGLFTLFQGSSELARDSAVPDQPELTPKDWRLRRILLGAQAYQGAGFLSAYSAFRTAVPSFQYAGRYRFLTPDPLPDVLLAPAHFSFLGRPTTFIPLGILAGYVGWLVYDERQGHPRADWAFTGDDVPFSAALSYNAGVTEEAAFRGYLLPVFYEYTHSFFLSNLLQAGLFGAAHYSGGPIPWPQALLGYYFGYLSERNHWTLSEGIFNHFWWDALLLTGSFLILPRAQVSAAFTLPISAW